MNQANETNPKLHVEHASTGTSARFWNKQMESDTKGKQGAPDTQSSNVVLHCRIDSEMDSLLLKTLPNFKIINQSINLSIYQSINQSINQLNQVSLGKFSIAANWTHYNSRAWIPNWSFLLHMSLHTLHQPVRIEHCIFINKTACSHKNQKVKRSNDFTNQASGTL